VVARWKLPAQSQPEPPQLQSRPACRQRHRDRGVELSEARRKLVLKSGD